MEIADLDVDQLGGMSTVEQAWIIETAERQVDELERHLAEDSDSVRTIERMRRHILEVQCKLYGY